MFVYFIHSELSSVAAEMLYLMRIAYVICYMPAVLNSVYELPEDGTDVPEHGVVKTRLLNVFVTCAGSWCYN